MTQLKTIILFALVSLALCINAQGLTVSEVVLFENRVANYNSPVDFSLIDNFEDWQFTIIHAVELEDGSKIILAKYESPSSSSPPDTFINVFLDSDGNVTSMKNGAYTASCHSKIIYSTFVNETDLLFIGSKGSAYTINNCNEVGFGPYFCDNKIFDLGRTEHEIYTTEKVIRTGNYLTVISQATNSNNIRGTLHTIIKIDTQEEINNFFIPTPTQGSYYHKMTGLVYLSEEHLIASYSASIDTVGPDFLCSFDRQRNILAVTELEEGFKVEDLILDEKNNLILAGSLGIAGHLRMLSPEQDIMWSHTDDNVDSAGDTVSISAFKKVLLSPQNELIVAGHSRSYDAHKFVGNNVTISCYNRYGGTRSLASFGTYPYGYSYENLYYTDQGSLWMLHNYRHTGRYHGFLFDFKTRKPSTSVSLAQNKLFSAYPNPFSKIINIDLDPRMESNNTTFKLIDIDGRTILSDHFIPQINVPDLPKGVYFLELSYGQRNFTKVLLHN